MTDAALTARVRAIAARITCPVVLVGYGYNHGRPVAEAAPDAVIDRLDALDLARWA